MRFRVPGVSGDSAHVDLVRQSDMRGPRPYHELRRITLVRRAGTWTVLLEEVTGIS